MFLVKWLRLLEFLTRLIGVFIFDWFFLEFFIYVFLFKFIFIWGWFTRHCFLFDWSLWYHDWLLLLFFFRRGFRKRQIMFLLLGWTNFFIWKITIIIINWLINRLFILCTLMMFIITWTRRFSSLRRLVNFDIFYLLKSFWKILRLDKNYWLLELKFRKILQKFLHLIDKIMLWITSKM